jgi:hypothetical protein
MSIASAGSRLLLKNIPLEIFRKSAILTASRLIEEGRTRRHERRVRDAVAALSRWTNGRMRTAKSCGPGIPVLMPSPRRFDEHAGDRGKKAGP